MRVCLPGETPFRSNGCSSLDGGRVVSSVADRSFEFDVREANSYAIAEVGKEGVDEQERQEEQERNTRTQEERSHEEQRPKEEVELGCT